MSEAKQKGEYRLSSLGVILFGILFVLVGGGIALYAHGFTGIGWIVLLGGIVLLIVGALRGRNLSTRKTAPTALTPSQKNAFDAWVAEKERELKAPSPYDDSPPSI